jgi:hypothetical protein
MASTVFIESAGLGARVVADSFIVGVDPFPKYWLVIFFSQATTLAAATQIRERRYIFFFMAAIIEV